MATALITGASNGIGLELARIFAHAGINLVLVARSTGKLKALEGELQQQYPSLKILVLTKDLSLPDAAQDVYQELNGQKIQIDYLVNNAGFGDFGFFTETDWDKEAQMIDLNIKALTQFSKLFIKDMQQRGKGKVLNVASTAAFQPGPLMAVYFATKAYVLHLSEALHNELKGTGVTVTALCPGPTESGFVDIAGMGKSKLVKGRKLPTSAAVADYGFKAMMRGKAVAIHGGLNKVMVFAQRFTPRSWTTAIVRKIQG